MLYIKEVKHKSGASLYQIHDCKKFLGIKYVDEFMAGPFLLKKDAEKALTKKQS